MKHPVDLSQAKKLILAGKATITLRNKETGNRYTYKINCPPDRKIFFVKLLCGPDNTSNYKYIGFIRNEIFSWGNKSSISKESMGVQAFEFVFNSILAPGKTSTILEVWHEGRCCRCGRKLTVPESIKTGFGPECYARS